MGNLNSKLPKIPVPQLLCMRNARASSGVLLVFSWNGINVIFLIQKLHLCHPKGHRCNFLITFMPCQENTKRTQGDALAFLIMIYDKLTPVA
jgi:hypothetical protein